jgi:hypothetical protein
VIVAASGIVRRTLYERYESGLQPRQPRLLETANLFGFTRGQALEHFANATRRAGFPDMNDFGHVLTSMMQLYGQ